MTSKQHRKQNLRFTHDHVGNRNIVEYFYTRIEDRRVTAATKQYAIWMWGFSDARAGMWRAFRMYRHLHLTDKYATGEWRRDAYEKLMIQYAADAGPYGVVR